jgi:hypothetical protein
VLGLWNNTRILYDGWVQFRQRVFQPTPILSGVVAAVLALTRTQLGLTVLVAGVFVVATGISLVIMVTGRINIVNGQLTASGTPPVSKRYRGPRPVVLRQLTVVHSVMLRSGLLGQIGPGFARPFLYCEDTQGNMTIFWVWGWKDKSLLKTQLREAVSQSGARTDLLSARRIGLIPSR